MILRTVLVCGTVDDQLAILNVNRGLDGGLGFLRGAEIIKLGRIMWNRLLGVHFPGR